MKNLAIQDFLSMNKDEKTAYVYSILGFTRNELARMIAEWEYQEGKSPNAIMISFKTLHTFNRLGVTIKKLEFDRVTLVIIPLDAEEEKTILCEVDPWDPRWEHLFF